MSDSIQSVQPLLEAGCQTLGFALSSLQQQQFGCLLELLGKWNKIHNLTAIHRPREQVCRHLLDSLSVQSFLSDEPCVLDVGTGAGFPGLPLAIIRPEQRWLLLDSNHKKTSFIRMAVAACGVENVQVLTQRIEQFGGGIKAEQPSDDITAIITRAFADPVKALGLFAGKLATNQRVYLMLGKAIAQQCEHPNFTLLSIESLKVPFLEGERNLATLVRKAN